MPAEMNSAASNTTSSGKAEEKKVLTATNQGNGGGMGSENPTLRGGSSPSARMMMSAGGGGGGSGGGGGIGGSSSSSLTTPLLSEGTGLSSKGQQGQLRDDDDHEDYDDDDDDDDWDWAEGEEEEEEEEGHAKGESNLKNGGMKKVLEMVTSPWVQVKATSMKRYMLERPAVAAERTLADHRAELGKLPAAGGSCGSGAETIIGLAPGAVVVKEGGKMLPAGPFGFVQRLARWRRGMKLRGVLAHAAVSSIAALLFGYHLSIVNGPLDAIARDFAIAHDPVAKGLIVSLFLLGAFLGCFCSSWLADVSGRRRGLQISAGPVLLGSLLSASASSLPMMLLGRFLVGCGLGAGTPILAMFISEISPSSSRGTLGSLPQVAVSLGILSALLAASSAAGGEAGGWRLCFLIGALPAVVLMAGCELMFESPTWLLQSPSFSSRREAEKAADGLWGMPNGRMRLAELKAAQGSRVEDGEGATWKELFSKRYAKVLFLGASLFALQQLSGINAIFYFSSTIFATAGVSSQATASLLMGAINLATALLSSLLVDRVGRKPLMAASFCGMGAAMSAQALSSFVPLLAPLTPSIALWSTIIYVAAFAMGAGPIPGILLPEIFPLNVRAKGVAASICVHWIFNFMVGFLFLPLLETIGATSLYSIFACVCFVAAVFTQIFVVETKGKSLEEIEDLFIAKV